MHFEKSIARAIYSPWKDKYIDYSKLKSLLRDEGSDSGSSKGPRDPDDDWTEEDEGAFVEELVNVQLEKVHAFQADMLQKLRDRTSTCEQNLDPISSSLRPATDSLRPDDAQDPQPSSKLSDDQLATLNSTLKELDGITKEMNELEKFSRINYSGFLKAAKKHDRKRGYAYRVMPLMQVRLAALPFNKEDFAPLLFRVSTMYSFIRQNLDTKGRQPSLAESHTGNEEFTSHKFWVHPDNILELKTMILRRLPVLVYNPQSAKIAEGGRTEPTITSIYFDNPSFDLYNTKVEHNTNASSLRMRWYGHLTDNPEIYCERKTVSEDDVSREEKVTLKSKYVQRFVDGNYKMDKDVAKLKDRLGDDAAQVKQLESQVDDIQGFIEASELQPVLRANYTRTAFQIPGDSRVRITLDTEIAMIREDALDPDRPCRDPDTWHRTDIDDLNMEYPFDKINKGEISRFPFALLEIRIRGGKRYEWTQDLMTSHLVHAAPRFSKFIHGVAQLFDDYVNTFPFWLSEIDSDIRRDPQEAFDEEQARKIKAAEDEFAVGSLLKTTLSPHLKPATKSPVGSPQVTPKSRDKKPEKITPDMTRKASQQFRISDIPQDVSPDDSSSEGPASGGFKSLFPSLTRFAQMHSSGQVKLPAGVHEPSFWIKDEGEVKVEAKVWLANQRTFIKWQHVGILLSTISLGLFNAAGESNNIARTVAVIYTCVGVGTALWGFGMYLHRSTLIRKRSGKDFDNVFGPIIVCLALIFALLFNFGFKYQALQDAKRKHHGHGGYSSNQTIPTEL